MANRYLWGSFMDIGNTTTYVEDWFPSQFDREDVRRAFEGRYGGICKIPNVSAVEPEATTGNYSSNKRKSSSGGGKTDVDYMMYLLGLGLILPIALPIGGLVGGVWLGKKWNWKAAILTGLLGLSIGTYGSLKTLEFLYPETMNEIKTELLSPIDE